ncbi:MAG: hypothetical protein AAFS10_10170 [Myxococcota bacterium]
MAAPPTTRLWVLGHPPLCAPVLARLSDHNPMVFDPLDPDALPFFRWVNAGNHLAYAGLGMPAWVQLDCCTLPSAMIGLALPIDALPKGLLDPLNAQVARLFGDEAALEAQRWTGLVPISSYCATPSWTPGTVVGFSLFSLIRGARLAVPTKALALKGYGCTRQIGITQYTNPALRTHTALGPLAVTHPRAWPHSLPERTFVYQLILDDPGPLDARITQGPPQDDEPPAGALLIPVIDDGRQMAQHLRELTAQHGPLHIVWPGLTRDRRLVIQMGMGAPTTREKS